MQHTINIPAEAEQDARLIMAGEYDVPLDHSPTRILDIGGNVGLYSIKAAQTYPGAEIIAYEPWPENAENFRQNTAVFPNVTLHEAGVRLIGHDGEEMRRGRNRMCCSFLANQGDAQTVTVISASDLPKADIVKIDTEGCELEILQGIDLSETQAVMCEAHSDDDRAAILELMAKRGFHVFSDAPSVNGCHLLKFTRNIHRAPKLFVALPIYGQVPWAFAGCVRELERRPPCSMVIAGKVGDSLVSRARNVLVAEFLETDCTHLLFIDSDLVFSPEHVKALLDANEEIIAGLYPKKQQGPVQWVANAQFEQTLPDFRGVQDVRYMGTGFLMIKRAVIERMIADLGDELWYAPDDKNREREHDLFRVGVYRYPDGSRRYLSEDWYFCQMAMDIGYRVKAHTKVICKHIGTAVYPLKTQEEELTKAREAAEA